MLVSLGLAVIAACFGLVGAYYWLRSSRVVISPTWLAAGQIEPIDPVQSQMGWLIGVLQASQESARLNAIGARATAAATILGVLSVLAAALA